MLTLRQRKRQDRLDALSKSCGVIRKHLDELSKFNDNHDSHTGEFSSGSGGSSSSNDKPTAGDSKDSGDKVHATTLRFIRGALTVAMIGAVAIPVATAVAAMAALAPVTGGALAISTALGVLIKAAPITSVVALGILRHITGNLIDKREAELNKAKNDPVLAHLKKIQAALAAYKVKDEKKK